MSNVCKKCEIEFKPIKGLINYCSYKCRNLHVSNRGRAEEEILQIATDNKHLSRNEFKLKFNAVIHRARKMGILTKVNEIIKTTRWAHTYEECMEASLKCKTLKEFRNDYEKEYMTSLRKGWYDVIERLERTDMNHSKRCVYVYEFSDNSIYVGLTWNFEERHNQHMLYDITGNKTSVKQYIDKTGLQPIYRIVLDYTDKVVASKYEEKLRKEYKDKGYNVLNKNKGGGLGYSKKLKKEEVHNEALKYDSRKQFCDNSKGHYARAIKEGWLDEVCGHMKSTEELQLYWSEERVKKIIEEHNITNRSGKNGLKTISIGAYSSARKKGFLEKLLPNHKYDKSNKLQVGSKVGKLTIIKRYMSEKDKYGRKSMVDCICDCGLPHTTHLARIVSGHTKSCGCMRKEKRN